MNALNERVHRAMAQTGLTPQQAVRLTGEEFFLHLDTHTFTQPELVKIADLANVSLAWLEDGIVQKVSVSSALDILSPRDRRTVEKILEMGHYERKAK